MLSLEGPGHLALYLERRQLTALAFDPFAHELLELEARAVGVEHSLFAEVKKLVGEVDDGVGQLEAGAEGDLVTEPHLLFAVDERVGSREGALGGP